MEFYMCHGRQYLSSRMGTPHPLFSKRVCPSPRTEGDGTLACGWVVGGGGPNSDDWRKQRLVLCLLCECTYDLCRRWLAAWLTGLLPASTCHLLPAASRPTATPRLNRGGYSFKHKVRIYKEYHSVWPLVGIGTLPSSSLTSECAPPPNRGGGGGGHTRLRLRGCGSPHSDDWRKSLALCLLCGFKEKSGIWNSRLCPGFEPTNCSPSCQKFLIWDRALFDARVNTFQKVYTT